MAKRKCEFNQGSIKGLLGPTGGKRWNPNAGVNPKLLLSRDHTDAATLWSLPG